MMMILALGCRDIGVTVEIFVYGNDFNNGDYTGIEGVYISEFEGNKLMGNFNNSGFTLSLSDLPEHDFIRVFFDLYIHDSWEGNTNQVDDLDLDHDAWFLEFDPDKDVDPSEKIIFETTFSNGLCIPGWCFTQSYPNEYPFHNEARKTALRRSTVGICLWQDSPIGTSIYKFDKVFPHTEKSTLIAFYDQLKEGGFSSNACDESWSLDNLGVSVFTRDN